MMLLTLARSPASWAAMLPQKFSAAMTVSLAPRDPPPAEAAEGGAPLRPQPLASAASASPTAAARPMRRGGDVRCGISRGLSRPRALGRGRRGESGHYQRRDRVL